MHSDIHGLDRERFSRLVLEHAVMGVVSGLADGSAPRRCAGTLPGRQCASSASIEAGNSWMGKSYSSSSRDLYVLLQLIFSLIECVCNTSSSTGAIKTRIASSASGMILCILSTGPTHLSFPGSEIELGFTINGLGSTARDVNFIDKISDGRYFRRLFETFNSRKFRNWEISGGISVNWL